MRSRLTFLVLLAIIFLASSSVANACSCGPAMYTYVGEFEHCALLDKAIKETGENNAELTTPPLQLTTERNYYDVELKYPFPGCKKAKE